ncbi:adenylate/guanylate cyclase domain-containing protein [Nocardioides pyridinolyticus]
MTDPHGRTWTVAIVDLAGYTALTETHGDEEPANLATTFADLARSCLLDGDRLIKPIGDAVLLASQDPRSGLALVDRLLAATCELDGFPLARAGLHHGPAVERDGDMFGAAVNLAARVAGQAAGGQTVVTTPIADAARQDAR